MPQTSIYHFYLLRHGESLGNANRLVQGQWDAPLSKQGLEQAHALAHCWQTRQMTFDRIISSPLARAQTTARVIGDTLGLSVELNALWMERSFGKLEGQAIEDLRQQGAFDNIFRPYLTPGETGESLMETYRRAVMAVQELLRMEPGCYLVVSHGAFLNMVLYHILGIDPQKFSKGPRFIIENTAYSHLSYEPETGLWRVLGINFQAPRLSGN